MRKIPFYPLMVLLLVGLGGYLGCDPNSIQMPIDGGPTGITASSNPQYTASIPARSDATVLIASFNIQRLGPSKLGDPWVMDKFAEVIRQFDVVALQEITSKDQTALDQLLQEVNKRGARYAYTLGPRVGREALGYYEQYAYVFDTQRVFTGMDYSYSVGDELDLLHREPWVGRFRTSTTAGKPFEFTLINIHTDPDEVREELDVLAEVYVQVRQYEYPEDDVILLGDLNAEPHRLQKLGEIPSLVPLIDGIPTNTRKTKTIDNFLVDRQTTREFTGRAGVIDLESMFSLSRDDALRISDHLPVWAEFTTTEQPPMSTAMGGASTTLR